MESPALVLFGPSHVATLALVAAVSLGLPLWVRRHPTRAHTVAWALALLILVHEVVKVAVRVGVHGYPIEQNLPLHLCSVAAILGAVMLVRRSERLWELVYFWGFGGTLQALITPDIEYGFPHSVYWFFMISHGSVLLFALYGILVYGFRPSWSALPRVLLALNLYAALVTPINLWLDANYLYLRWKPHQASLIDHLGPWPWYILALEALALLSFCLWMLPFHLLDALEARQEHRAQEARQEHRAEQAPEAAAQRAARSANQ